MPLQEKTPVLTSFAESFMNMDEADATGGSFEAPKKENRWCLMEVTKDQLAALEAGTKFHIKEHSTKHGGVCRAALSMEDKTFALEFLENSNPMYLGNVYAAPGKQDPNAENKAELANKDGTEAPGKDPLQCSIFAQCRGHLFVKPSQGDFQRVRDVLMAQPIEAAADGGRGAAITTSQLQYQVAASPKELQQILEKGPYVECAGGWCWTPAAFEREVTDAALNLIAVNGWDKAAVPVKDLFREVQRHFGEDHVPSEGVLRSVLRGLVKSAAPVEVEKATEDKKAAEDKKADEKVAAEGAEKAAPPTASSETARPPKAGELCLDVEKVNVFQATQLLRESPARIRERFDLSAVVIPPRPKRPRLGNAPAAAGGREASLQVEEFVAAFSALTGTETTIEDLHKILDDSMYIDEMDGAVRPLDISALPQEPRERLRRLFELSSHWKPERLSLLMAPAVTGVKVDAWLLKCTRVVYIEFEKGKETRMMTKKFGGLS
jgi:hypothetical protein